MAIDKLQFTRDWTKAEDFPTIETDETVIRADMQALHDETKQFINETLIPAVDINSGKSHEHENKELLDSYTQSEENLADAVSKKHDHQNKELLDSYTQSEENLADAVSKKHEHENMDVLSGIKAVTQELTNTEDEVPSGKAVSTALTQSGLLPGGSLTGQVLTKTSDLAFELDWMPVTPETVGAAPAEHTHTPEDAGAAPADHTHTAAAVGAATADHTHTLDSLGAAASGHTHTAADVGAATADHTHTAASVGAAASSHNHAASNITSGTLGVARGGTGAKTFTSGAALIGAGTGAVTTRAITNNTATSAALTGSTNLVTMNTLRYALNRTTGIGSADTNYNLFMMRGIAAGTSDMTAGTSNLASGTIYLVYE